MDLDLDFQETAVTNFRLVDQSPDQVPSVVYLVGCQTHCELISGDKYHKSMGGSLLLGTHEIFNFLHQASRKLSVIVDVFKPQQLFPLANISCDSQYSLICLFNLRGNSFVCVLTFIPILEELLISQSVQLVTHCFSGVVTYKPLPCRTGDLKYCYEYFFLFLFFLCREILDSPKYTLIFVLIKSKNCKNAFGKKSLRCDSFCANN